MYDLEIIVPAELRFIQRFNDFRKWGLLNIGDNKVKLILAASSGNDTKDFIDGWPEGVDVEIIETPYVHVAQRIYYYYDSIIKPDTARWYMRIDEDSVTDIDGLMNNLNQLFDHNKEYHITSTSINYDVQPVEREIICSLGFGYWYDHPALSPPHEWEVSISSNAAIKEILNNVKAKHYFKIRKEKPTGYGDHGLCFCARMAKIHPTPVKFLSIQPELVNLSIFGGYLNHIHWISRDKNACVLEWLECESDDVSNVSDQFFLWTNKVENNRKIVKLCENNVVKELHLHNNSLHPLKVLWKKNKDDIIFFMEKMEQNIPLSALKHNNGIFENNKHELKNGSISELFSTF